MQNYFFLLELPCDSPDLDEDAVRHAIDDKQRQWTSDMGNPIKRVLAMQCLEQLSTIKAVMLHSESRAEEARKAIEIRAGKEMKLQEEICMLLQMHEAVLDVQIKRLVKKYKQYGFSRENIASLIEHLSAAERNLAYINK